MVENELGEHRGFGGKVRLSEIRDHELIPLGGNPPKHCGSVLADGRMETQWLARGPDVQWRRGT